MTERHHEKIWTKSFVSISLTQFFLFTVFYALLTTLPIYVIHHLGESESKAGLVVTFMLGSAILIRPFSAKILDILGKKRSLVISTIMFTITTFAYIWIDAFIPLLVVRFIHGISFAVVTTTTGAIVADIVPSKLRGEGMGYFAMALNLAMVIGPFIGLTVLQYGSFHLLFMILNVIMIAGILFSINVKLEESPRPKKMGEFSLQFSDLIDVNALPIALIGSLVGFSYASILSFVSLYAEEIGLSATVSYFFLIFAATMIISRPYLGRTFDKKGPKVVLIPSLVVFAVGLVLLGFTKSSFILLISGALIGLGFGTLLPGFQTIAINSTASHRNGHAMSTFFVVYDIGIASGAFALGLIVSRFGFSKMYFASALIVLMTVFIFNTYLTSKEQEKQKQRVFQEVSE